MGSLMLMEKSFADCAAEAVLGSPRQRLLLQFQELGDSDGGSILPGRMCRIVFAVVAVLWSSVKWLTFPNRNIRSRAGSLGPGRGSLG